MSLDKGDPFGEDEGPPPEEWYDEEERPEDGGEEFNWREEFTVENDFDDDFDDGDDIQVGMVESVKYSQMQHVPTC